MPERPPGKLFELVHERPEQQEASQRRRSDAVALEWRIIRSRISGRPSEAVRSARSKEKKQNSRVKTQWEQAAI